MQQRLAEYKVFWRQFREAYHTTGAVLPSGRGLALALAHFVRNGAPNSTNGTTIRPRRILEVGPGTGAVTTQIAGDLRPDDQLILVERNDEFVKHLKMLLSSSEKFQVTRDRITLIHSSVEDLPSEPFDLIVSGLPLNNFSVELVDQLLSKMQSLLAPTGILSFFEYVAIRRAKAIVSPQRDRQRLRGIERILDQLLANGEIRRELVLANVPPAWVHHVSPTGSNGASS
jgi:phospholipid N-methyltransferase